ncbi:dTDP-4-dehydrorhamnose 3,5-epimerase [Bordetella avium]|uniref:dTDP-4-dehydrorhamnose 3,5-epimerase n=1 Tax=Bordetella avium (strain 197N) TaxID=360910 RepID=Q2L1I1_BORA1|nr:dTDP-4-dehydrorhamnose 3,5-epimerase [Bordetella avium]AZY47801.1 dTDP-4-dehydrorhamnose 3,5-epimerase [Bordetella avium]AZY51172.1 dTDP-4-dehydrorhamnose 3,5-epimerase [Bordetella avium]RIQ14972.1 dTDP-4-dehydrorhamnose 3,5-epimerase [Bordetella avium]RIQ18537.1 dTDP-4-dehydrorhamnose 3,5-epimerase [Bordetella avium]RIQ35427.1 dTDP-4-dehydrorhamnose 3,5-epimerase [Bordetella avium]
MNFSPTTLPGVVLLDPKVFADARGWFAERFRQDVFEAGLRALGLPVPAPFVQENHSCSRQGVLRGLHYQLAPHAQGKLVSVAVGEIFDVTVDIRPDSPTFGRWQGVTLSAVNRRSLWIPAGYAHGFLSLSGPSEVHYKTTAYYSPAHERSLRWNDPFMGIVWPAEVSLLSERDERAPGLQEALASGQLDG